MKIKCSLIEIGNDQRAVITVGNEVRGKCSVKTTGKVDSVDYERGEFRVGAKVYDFR